MERVAFSVAKNALLPASGEANAVMAKLKIGETVAVEIYRERANKFSSKVQFVFERIANSEGVRNRVRNVRGWVAAMTGRADIVCINGVSTTVPWGTGPRDMGGDEFEGFWEDAKQVIADDILPRLTADDASAVRSMMEFGSD